MIKVYHLNQLDQAIARFIESTRQRYKSHYDSMMKKFVVVIRADIADHFDKMEGPTGKWNMLKHPRPGSKGKDKPLQDTGLLKRAATTNAPGNITRYDGTTITVGVNMVQARLMQEGGIVKAKNVEFLCIPATQEAKRVGSPRRFPRPLKPIINKKRTGGVLVEVPKKPPKGSTPSADAKMIKDIERQLKKASKQRAIALRKKLSDLRKKKKASAAPKQQVVQYYMTKETVHVPRPFLWISDKAQKQLGDIATDTFTRILRARALEENH